MSKNRTVSTRNQTQDPPAITRLEVGGFKSIGESRTIEIRPLTVLAGANSSGKSSMLQPILLLKQTLDVSYDPGPLLLDGANVKFTSADQLLSRRGKKEHSSSFYVSIHLNDEVGQTEFVRGDKGFDISGSSYQTPSGLIALSSNMTPAQAKEAALPDMRRMEKVLKGRELQWEVARERCFLQLQIVMQNEELSRSLNLFQTFVPTYGNLEAALSSLIHLPGLRGNPERTYPVTAVGSTYPGTFDKYTASVITQWQEQKDAERLRALGEDLKRLGLTWKVTTYQKDDTRVELRVGRLPQATQGGAGDLVNIADVGFGVSQTLPVVVALHAARPGQVVYLEQPEIHLHPRAQFAMAQVLADAVARGVRVVVETHSTLLVLGLQTLIAENGITPDLVKFHWFMRDPKTGFTEVASTDLDAAGAFDTDWPEDFAEEALKAEHRYLTAAEQQRAKQRASNDDEGLKKAGG